MSNLVSHDAAQRDIAAWLDLRRVSEKKRSEYESTVNELVEAVESGRIVFFQETGILELKLEFPLGESGSVKSLMFNPRLHVSEVRSAIQTLGVKTGDGDGRLVAYIAAATKQPSGVILKMDTADHSLAGSIALFFM